MRDFHGHSATFTDKEITPWGGLSLMKQMLDHLHFDEAFTQAEMPRLDTHQNFQFALQICASKHIMKFF